jgi:hypothetical protein
MIWIGKEKVTDGGRALKEIERWEWSGLRTAHKKYAGGVRTDRKTRESREANETRSFDSALLDEI